MNTTFRSLRIRNFRLFFMGQAISQVGTWMRMVAMSLLVLHITDSGLAVGLMTAFQFLPVLVLGAWAGLVADRSDKRRLLLVVQSVLMAQSFVLSALAFMDSPPVAALYAVALAGGVATAFDNPARRSFVTEMVPEDHVQNAVALNTTVMTGARIFGPAVAGLLITATDYGWAFLIDGVSYTAVLTGLWRMRTEELRAAPLAPRGRGGVREGLRYVRRTPELWISLAMMGVVGTLAFNFQVTFPLLATRTFDGGEQLFTVLFSVLSIGSVIGSLWAARRETVELRHVVVSSAAFGVSMLLMAWSPRLAMAFPFAVLVGLSSVMFMTSSTALLQLRADPRMRGRVLALQAMVFLGSTPIGGPVVGWVSETLGARAGFVLGGAACLVAAAWGAAAGRRQLDAAVPAEGLLTPSGETTLQSA